MDQTHGFANIRKANNWSISSAKDKILNIFLLVWKYHRLYKLIYLNHKINTLGLKGGFSGKSFAGP